jgi:hypothetical protein
MFLFGKKCFKICVYHFFVVILPPNCVMCAYARSRSVKCLTKLLFYELFGVQKPDLGAQKPIKFVF